MDDLIFVNADPISRTCFLLAGGMALLLRSKRIRGWWSRHYRQIHGEICECLFCGRLLEMEDRIAELELLCVSLSERVHRAEFQLADETRHCEVDEGGSQHGEFVESLFAASR